MSQGIDDIDVVPIKRNREKEQREYALILEQLKPLKIKIKGHPLIDLWDLVNTRESFSAVLPIVTSLLPKVKEPRVRECISRILCDKATTWNMIYILVKEFKRFPKNYNYSSSRWSMGNTISAAKINEDLVPDILELVQNKQYGDARQMLILWLAKTKQHQKLVIKPIIECLKQPSVQGHAICALGKLKAKSAVKAITPFLESNNAWHRKEARTALKRINQ